MCLWGSVLGGACMQAQVCVPDLDKKWITDYISIHECEFEWIWTHTAECWIGFWIKDYLISAGCHCYISLKMENMKNEQIQNIYDNYNSVSVILKQHCTELKFNSHKWIYDTTN